MLHWREMGNSAGDTILFLHGGGLSGKSWEEVASRLESSYRCLLPDLPGHGLTAPDAPLTAARCLEEVEARLAPGQKVHLVGLSLGGAIALYMLLHRPQLVRSAVISGTSAGISPTMQRMLDLFAAPMYRLLSPERLARMTMKAHRIPERHAADVLADSHRMTADAVRAMHGILRGIRLPTHTDPPLLVLAGERENRIARQSAADITRAVSGSVGALVPDAGHVWSYEDPQLFADTVRLWIEEQTVHPALRPLPSSRKDGPRATE